MGIKQSEMVRFLYNPIDLLCIQVSTLPFLLKICAKKYEIAACIINVWGYTEILPQITTFMVAEGNPWLMAVDFTTLCNQGSINRA